MDRIAILCGFIEKNPADMFSRHALALEYVKSNDYTKAISTFESLLERDSSYVGSYYHLGKAYAHLGNPLKALEVYAIGIEVAKQQNDQHARRELMAAHDLLQDEMDD